MKVHLAHFVARTRFVTSPKREAISRSVNLLREMFHVVNRILAKALCVSSGILSTRFLVLISAHSCVWKQEHMCVKHLSIESILQRMVPFFGAR